MILIKTGLILLLILYVNLHANRNEKLISKEQCELKYENCLKKCDNLKNVTEECYQTCDIKLSRCEEKVIFK